MFEINNYSTKKSSYSISIFDRKNLPKEIEKGNHQTTVQHLNTRGPFEKCLLESFSLPSSSSDSLAFFQIKEMLAHLPAGEQLPTDLLSSFISDDSQGENIRWVEELLPDLEKFNYCFNRDYARAIEFGHLPWVEFFLTRSFSNLDLNTPISHKSHIAVHPLTELELLATRISILCCYRGPYISSGAKQEMQHQLGYIHEIIWKMSHHPAIHFNTAKDEMEKLREYLYFEGDPQWEQDCVFFSEAATLEGLEKQVAAGWDLYKPIGPFSICMDIDGDISWLEFLCFVYGFSENELVDLMEKYP